MKILILKFRNIGDVLLVTPLLDNLKAHYPDALIDIAVNKGTEAMVEGHPTLHSVITYNRSFIKSLGIWNRLKAELAFAWKLRTTHYDIVINLTEGDRGAQLALISNAPIRIGYHSKNRLFRHAFTHFLPPQKMRHTLECNLDPLLALGLPILTHSASIAWNEQESDATKEYTNFIHIHPVSRWLFKCIDDALMAQIIDFCQEELQTPVILTASADEMEIKKIEKILSFCKTSPINLSGKLSLKETAALNAKAKMFIGVDTAIMHISAANDIPVLAFFGPSGAFHWGPWDNALSHSSYTKRNGFQTMGKHRVLQVDWTCAPCGKDGCHGSKISDCLMQKGLDIEMIKHHIKEMIHD